MVRLNCKDYGNDCQFVAQGEDISQVIEKFGKHTLDEHGIKYSKEGLMQFILRQ